MARRLGVQTHRSEVTTLRPGRRNSAIKLLTKDASRRIAANIAKLPELLRKP